MVVVVGGGAAASSIISTSASAGEVTLGRFRLEVLLPTGVEFPFSAAALTPLLFDLEDLAEDEPTALAVTGDDLLQAFFAGGSGERSGEWLFPFDPMALAIPLFELCPLRLPFCDGGCTVEGRASLDS